MRTNYKHFTEGGTMITNFALSDYQKMVNAMKQYHKEIGHKVLFIKKSAWCQGGTIELKGDGSLHFRPNMEGDLSLFWEIYETNR